MGRHAVPGSFRDFVLLALVLLGASCSEYNLQGQPPDVNPGDVTPCGFSPIPGSVMSAYDCNPVLEGDMADRASAGFLSTPVVAEPFYQLWYTVSSSSGSGYALDYAISPDGTTWEENPADPLLTNQPGQWDQDDMDTVKVVWDPSQHEYVMAYQGVSHPTATDAGVFGLGMATSPDGVAWTKYAGNPVMDFSRVDPSPCWPLALTRSASGFTGYLAVMNDAGACDVYRASATSLSDWQMGLQPVLRAGGTWDAAGVSDAAVVDFRGTEYMFYIGFTGWLQEPGYILARDKHLLLATSTDGGQTWTKQPDPLPVAPTSDGEVSGIGAEVVGSRIHLWVTDYYASVGGQAIGYFLYEPDIQPHP